MAIAPVCDKCGEEMQDFGGLLFSPPTAESTVQKFHLCKSCYADIEQTLKK